MAALPAGLRPNSDEPMSARKLRVCQEQGTLGKRSIAGARGLDDGNLGNHNMIALLG